MRRLVPAPRRWSRCSPAPGALACTICRDVLYYPPFGSGRSGNGADWSRVWSCGPLAQLAEQLTLNQRVRGSSPWRLTRKSLIWRGERGPVRSLAPARVRVCFGASRHQGRRRDDRGRSRNRGGAGTPRPPPRRRRGRSRGRRRGAPAHRGLNSSGAVSRSMAAASKPSPWRPTKCRGRPSRPRAAASRSPSGLASTPRPPSTLRAAATSSGTLPGGAGKSGEDDSHTTHLRRIAGSLPASLGRTAGTAPPPSSHRPPPRHSQAAQGHVHAPAGSPRAPGPGSHPIVTRR